MDSLSKRFKHLAHLNLLKLKTGWSWIKNDSFHFSEFLVIMFGCMVETDSLANYPRICDIIKYWASKISRKKKNTALPALKQLLFSVLSH
ncbi:hypothetical protein BpHYR1_048462 [Brachionus plicatilis]|uniref:Uncharacterized protein n=1 Tax=Brachionus plicatilis TaxID=10195 RepID=A0A3M7PLQ1_BRAPC|nr:hypothetical protein BpHYR1_048462 [Brachionus plicatilis]